MLIRVGHGCYQKTKQINGSPNTRQSFANMCDLNNIINKKHNTKNSEQK